MEHLYQLESKYFVPLAKLKLPMIWNWLPWP